MRNLLILDSYETHLTWDGTTLSGDLTVKEINGLSGVTFSGDNAFVFTEGYNELPPELPTGEFTITHLTLPTVDGNYIYSYDVQASGYRSPPFTIYLTVAINQPVVENPNPAYWTYGLKYFFEFNDARCEIFEKDFTGVETEIRGFCVHEYQNRKEVFMPVVASHLDMSLEGGNGVGLSDLYSESEYHFKVVLKKGGNIIFIGFIKPDDIVEDWTSDTWELRIDAVDGLSSLDKLAFTTWQGVEYEGKMTVMGIIEKCIERTGLNLPININCEIEVSGGDAAPLFYQILANTDRFYKDETMSCLDVLKSTLQVFNCTLIQMNGEWWIYRAIDMRNAMPFTLRFSHKSKDVLVDVGSHINNAEIFHVNKNQTKTITGSNQAYRVTYKLGPANSINSNPNLIMKPGLNADGWIIYNINGDTHRNSSGIGFTWDVSETSETKILELNEIYNTIIGDSFSLNFRATAHVYRDNLVLGYWFSINFYVETDNYYLVNNEGWVSKGSASETLTGQITRKVDEEQDINLEWEATTPPLPEDSSIYIKVNVEADVYFGGTIKYSSINFQELSIKPSGNNMKSINYTAYRDGIVSTVTKSNINVYNSDYPSDTYVGTLYLGDEPTSSWSRKGKAENLKILEINAMDGLRIAPRPMMEMRTDIMGYIEYMSLVSVSGVAEKMIPIKYSNDLKSGIISLTLREIDNANVNGRVDIENNGDIKVIIK